jgi:CBS domain-containing protein
MAANRIGALAVTSAADSTKIIGIVSERDYLTKVALLGKSSKTTPIIQICTHGEANLVTVNEDDSVDSCMKKVRTPVPHYCAFILICTITLSDISEEQSILHFHQTQLHFFIIIRHLLVRDSTGKIVSMFSVKDLCKCVVARHSEV